MKIRMLQDRFIYKGISLEKDKLYEVENIILNTYKIKVPKKQKGRFQYVLVDENEGELVD